MFEKNKKETQSYKPKEEFWSFKNFDWEKFQTLCDKYLDHSMVSHNAQVFYDRFMKTLVKIIKEIMPQKHKRKSNPVPWWTNECSSKLKERNKAKNTFQ